MKKWIRRVVSLVLVFSFAVTFSTFSVNAEDSIQEQIQEATAAIAELNSQKNELEKKYKSLESEVEKAKVKASTYAERKLIVEQELDLLKKNIELKSAELSLKQAEIDMNQRDYDDTYSLFKSRLVSMYKNNTSSSLSVLLGCDTFSEFLIMSDNIAAISRHDEGIMDTLVEKGKFLETARASLQDELDSLEADKATQQELYDELAALYQEANNELTSAQALKAATELDYEEILAELEKQNKVIDELMAQASNLDYVGGYYAWPVPGYTWISSGYGWRTLYGVANFHGGIDIAGSGIYGKNIIASNTGQVTTAHYGSTGYGNYVIIDHGGGYKTLYGHMSAIYVTTGQWVAQGVPIGAVGSTGNSTGPHLHFEIRINGEKTNPLNLVVRG